MRSVDRGWVNMCAYNFFVRGPKFTKFSSSNVRVIVVDHFLLRFSISPSVLEIFQKSLKLLKITPNFRWFLPIQILGGWSPKKLYPNYHACLTSRHVEEFCEVAPPSSKVIGMHMLNFGPSFEFIILKNCSGTPSPVSVG